MDENNSLKKSLANMKQEKDEVMEILDAKDIKVEDLHAYSFQIKSELSKVSEELYNTKIELS